MNAQKIEYGEIIKLGFKEKPQNDDVYFQQYGFQWCIITKKLGKNIYLDWEKENQLCKMIRVDRQQNIINTMDIKSLEHLEEIIGFFCNEKYN